MAHVRTVIPDSLLVSYTLPCTACSSLHFLNNPPCHPLLLSLRPWHSFVLLLKPFSIYPCPRLSLMMRLHTVTLKRSFYHPKDTSHLFIHLCLCTSYSLCLEYEFTCVIGKFLPILQEGVWVPFQMLPFPGPSPQAELVIAFSSLSLVFSICES